MLEPLIQNNEENNEENINEYIKNIIDNKQLTNIEKKRKLNELKKYLLKLTNNQNNIKTYMNEINSMIKNLNTKIVPRVKPFNFLKLYSSGYLLLI